MRKPTSMKTILNPKPATVKKAKKKTAKPSPQAIPMMPPKRGMMAKGKNMKGMVEGEC